MLDYTLFLFEPLKSFVDSCSIDSAALLKDSLESAATSAPTASQSATVSVGMIALICALAISLIINIVLIVLIVRKSKKRHSVPTEIVASKIDASAKQEKTETLPAIKPTPAKTPQEKEIRTFTDAHTKRFSICGISVQGTGHLAENIPCQDYHQVEILDAQRNIGIAVVSDGAGSAKNSAIGSEIVCENAIKYLKIAIEKFHWLEKDKLPDSAQWDKVVRETIHLMQIALFETAKSNECELKSLAATCIILFFSPEKSYFAHVGDGRAGIRSSDGWEAILTPHKGEESNQTVFVTNEILKPADLMISGVRVPETLVIDNSIDAFVLMSDGCEDGLWVKNKREELPDGDFKYTELNRPFGSALDKLIQTLGNKEYADRHQDVMSQFVERYNRNLLQETDDKTLCIGYIK